MNIFRKPTEEQALSNIIHEEKEKKKKDKEKRGKNDNRK